MDRRSRKLAKRYFDYIAEDNTVAAIDTVEGIYERTQVLLTHPEIGARYEMITDRNIRVLLLPI